MHRARGSRPGAVFCFWRRPMPESGTGRRGHPIGSILGTTPNSPPQAGNPSPIWRMAMASHTGQVRLRNEDRVACNADRGLAVLADGKADASMLVTFDPRHQQLVLQRVSGFKEADNKSLQLWALPQQGAPRSLGVMGDGKLDQLTAQETDVKAVPALAISLEPKGGVPSSMGPTGPVLFKGALIRRDL